MGGGAGPPMNSSHDPLNITPELLADLQAGLLDDATAARVRSRARCDPEAVLMLARLDTVRRELARLGRAGSPGDATDLEDREARARRPPSGSRPTCRHPSPPGWAPRCATHPIPPRGRAEATPCCGRG